MLSRSLLMFALVALVVVGVTNAMALRRGELRAVRVVSDSEGETDVDVDAESHIEGEVAHEAAAHTELDQHAFTSASGPQCPGTCMDIHRSPCPSGRVQHGACVGAASIVCCLPGTATPTAGNGQSSKPFTQGNNAGALNAASGVNFDKLKGIVPDPLIAKLPDVANRYKINTPLRLAHFLSQAGHESGGFTVLSENLNYDANGLVKVFGSYFNRKTAPGAAGQPQKIANTVYANRMGNGNFASGDGFKYRGRGYIQVTGKGAYAAYGQYRSLNAVADPDQLSGPYALDSAAWFFSVYKPNMLRTCDSGSNQNAVRAVTAIVNGGDNGLPDRVARFNRIYAAIR